MYHVYAQKLTWYFTGVYIINAINQSEGLHVSTVLVSFTNLILPNSPTLVTFYYSQEHSHIYDNFHDKRIWVILTGTREKKL